MHSAKYTQEDLSPHEGVWAVIKNVRGNILMQEHSKFGFWTIPIGKTKTDQNPREAIKEEVFEECNLVLEEFEEIFSKVDTYVREGKTVHIRGHLFEVKKYSGKMKNKEPEKHKQQIFLPLSAIKKLPFLSDATLCYLETQRYTRKAQI